MSDIEPRAPSILIGTQPIAYFDLEVAFGWGPNLGARKRAPETRTCLGRVPLFIRANCKIARSAADWRKSWFESSEFPRRALKSRAGERAPEPRTSLGLVVIILHRSPVN